MAVVVPYNAAFETDDRSSFPSDVVVELLFIIGKVEADVPNYPGVLEGMIDSSLYWELNRKILILYPSPYLHILKKFLHPKKKLRIGKGSEDKKFPNDERIGSKVANCLLCKFEEEEDLRI